MKKADDHGILQVSDPSNKSKAVRHVHSIPCLRPSCKHHDLRLDGRGGTYRDENTFDTSASRMIRHVAEVPASKTVCTLEEGPLTGWDARTLHEHVDKLIVCDLWENDSKGDGPDTYELCRLLRLGGLKAVYHPVDDRRAVFKTAARHYFDLRDWVRVTKHKITAAFHRWGVFKIEGGDRYSQNGRSRYLEELPEQAIRTQQERRHRMLGAFSEAKAEARQDLLQQGERYPEIEEFQEEGNFTLSSPTSPTFPTHLATLTCWEK